MSVLDKIFEHDKLKHFFIGTLFALLLMAFNVDSLWIAISCISLGILKEMLDHFTGGKKEMLDIVYTGATGVLMFLISLSQ